MMYNGVKDNDEDIIAAVRSANNDEIKSHLKSRELLTIIFCNQRSNLLFVLKFRKISKICKDISEYWLTEVHDSRFTKIVNIARFKNLRKLQCANNTTNTDLQQLMFLEELDLNFNDLITDVGLKHLNLNCLVANYNGVLTDEGIKHMINLQRLMIAMCTKITDNGLKNLQLKFLDCSGTRITNKGIAHMNLQVICAIGCPHITKDGIKYMNNCRLIK